MHYVTTWSVKLLTKTPLGSIDEIRKRLGCEIVLIGACVPMGRKSQGRIVLHLRLHRELGDTGHGLQERSQIHCRCGQSMD